MLCEGTLDEDGVLTGAPRARTESIATIHNIR
jgi:hypothetical protein